MKRTAFLVFYLSMFACSEPFTFDADPTEIIVVDALVSTSIGKSHVTIYRLDNEEQIRIDDLNVRVVDGDDQQFDFVFNAVTNNYQPLDANFAGIVGNKYRFEATSAGEVLYSSSYDSISNGFDFEISAKDTTIVEIVGASNQLVGKDAVAAIAIIPDTPETLYSKFEFSYSYIDFWSNQMVEIVSRDDFVLYTNLNVNNSQNLLSVPIGAKTRTPWFFFDNSRPSSQCLNAPECGEDPCCGNPCCAFFESWPAELKITQESLSASTYQFWENVDKLRKNDGLVFDTYPFPLEGNVTCANCEVDVVGLFRTVAESSQTVDVIL